jgi:stage IV sporulation protein A
VILLNSERPYSTEVQALRTEMEAKYHRPVIAMNCKQMQKSDIVKLLESVLLEFPISQVEFYIPKWTEMLPMENDIKQGIIRFATDWMGKMSKMRDLYQEDETVAMENTNSICVPFVRKIRTEDGTVELRIEVDDKHYYDFLSNITGIPITSEYQMIDMIKNLAAQKQEYEKVEDALDSVNARGYGVVTPGLTDIVMEEPELITHAGKYGVKIRANSPSVHMIKANIETEIAPIVGSKEQAEDLIAYIKEGEYSADGIWGANIFGKSLGELMEDGIRDKINRMDDECQTQLQNTMQKIVNDNNGGLVCIII